MVRAPCCSKMGLNRGPWTPEEDELLAKYIEAHGEGCWRVVPKAAGLLRCGKSCRLRWVNYLRPSVKRGNISEDEEDLIIKLHSLLGNRWSLIAARMPGRTDNEIKNYWNTHLSRKLTRKGINPKTHKQLDNSDSKRSKAGHCLCQAFNIPDPMHTNKAINNDNLEYKSSGHSALAFLETDCDHQMECDRRSFITNIRTSTVTDNIGSDVAKEVSDQYISNNYKEASSSSSESQKRSRISQELISLHSMINYRTISSVSSGRIHHLQWRQSDRASRQDCIRSDTTASNRLPSSVFCEFSETSSKCNSPSDNTKTSPVTAVSSLDYTILNEENDNDLLEKSTVSPVREFQAPFHGLKASTITMPASESDEVLNNTAAFHDSTKFFVSPKNALSGNKLHFIEPVSPNDPLVEEEIWNCVDNSAIAECLETINSLEKPNVWNNPECNIITGRFYDLREDFASFEWRLFNFFGDGDKGSRGLNHVKYLPEEFDDFQNLIQGSPL